MNSIKGAALLGDYIAIDMNVARTIGLLETIFFITLREAAKVNHSENDFYYLDNEYIEKRALIKPSEQIKFYKKLEKIGFLKLQTIKSDGHTIIKYLVPKKIYIDDTRVNKK